MKKNEFVNKSRNFDEVAKYRDFCVVTMVKALATKALKHDSKQRLMMRDRSTTSRAEFLETQLATGGCGPLDGALPCLT